VWKPSPQPPPLPQQQQQQQPLTAAWQSSHWNSPGAGNEGKAWGANTRSGQTGRPEVARFDPLPAPLLAIADRMATVAPGQLDHGTWRPNQANAISYTKDRGHYLGAHCDDRQLSGLILANLSLGCDAVMSYQHDRRPDEPPHKVVLPRRSLQLQTGNVRFNYRHGIANDALLGPRRISITFRKEKVGGAADRLS
jgi:alkylated DNA repair dioxygenase AlkB